MNLNLKHRTVSAETERFVVSSSKVPEIQFKHCTGASYMKTTSTNTPLQKVQLDQS